MCYGHGITEEIYNITQLITLHIFFSTNMNNYLNLYVHFERKMLLCHIKRAVNVRHRPR